MKRALLFAFPPALLLATCLAVTAFFRPGLLTGWFSSSVRGLSATNNNAEMVARVNSGVVIVVAKRIARQDASFQEEEEEDSGIESQQHLQPERGTGTGFIVDAAGFIVTNHHVIKDADRIRVKLADGRETKAVLQGSDTETDLALLKIEADNLTALPLGDSDAIRVGDPVVAIGNPLEYEYSVTAGIVSAKGRKVYNNAPYEEFIQTDAAINRGNSGGPLLNQAGEVVGVNTVIRVDGRGISFAVPSNVVRRVVSQLRVQGFVARGFLGLQPQKLTPEFREGLGLDQHQRGVLVVEVTADKPAARAGVKPYDVITKFDGRAISTQDDFFSFVANTAPQREVEMEVVRGREVLKLKATLDRRPDDSALGSQIQPAVLKPTSLKLGFAVRANTSEVQRTLKVGDGEAAEHNGIIVSEVDPLSAAEDAGLQVGHIILEANRQPVGNEQEFNRLIESLQPGDVLVLRVSTPRQKILSLLAIRIE